MADVNKYLIIFLIVFFIFALFARKYANPYKLIMVFGKKGSGKSTLIAKLAIRYIKRKRIVYSNLDLKIEGVRYFNVQDIGKFVFPEKSVVFIDEVGMIWDNRDYRNFRNDVRDYFKLQRHYKNTVYLFSQTFDIDVKLRNLTDYMFMVKSYGNIISIAHRVSRKLVVVEPTADSEGRIADGYELQPLILQLLGFRVAYFTFIPRWIKYFNSFEQADLPEIDFTSLSGIKKKKFFLFSWFSKLFSAPASLPDDVVPDDTAGSAPDDVPESAPDVENL